MDNSLNTSLRRQKIIAKNTLILNPVDSFSFIKYNHNIDFIENIYISDYSEYDSKAIEKDLYFPGRSRATRDIERIYSKWADALKCNHVSMRLLSGLHAHLVLFMGLGNIGDKIMLLPELAGGHFAVSGMLKRLGYKIIDIPINIESRSIDLDKAIALYQQEKPKIVFIDRSEGIDYEDFTPFINKVDALTIFDASHYLPSILSGYYKSPFEMGFDLIVSTLHKSIPGPQKALIAGRCSEETWTIVENSMRQYVSSFHVKNIYLAGFLIDQIETINNFSKSMIDNSIQLSKMLASFNVPLIDRDYTLKPTQHIWVTAPDKNTAFEWCINLQKHRILVNYRKLPYQLGFGLRLGTTSSTAMGLNYEHIEELAYFIQKIIYGYGGLTMKHKVRKLIKEMQSTCNYPSMKVFT